MDADIAKMLKSEPRITINGVTLTPSQAMAVRVACTDFAMDMTDPDALGDDETGRGIAAGYKARIGEVLQIIHQTA